MPKNCCKYFTVSLVPITALTLAVLFGCSVILLPILYEELATRTKYGIVIDAGSAHTDLYVYSWEVPTVATPSQSSTGLVKQIWYCGKNDSLNNYTSHPSDANKTFSQCLNNSLDYVADSLQSTTDLFLGATAGMRLVRDNDSTTADEIMEVANHTLYHSAYHLVSGKIISGREEAASGWATANYAMQGFNPLTEHTDGSLDLGGASIEIAFVSGHRDIDQQYMSKEVLFDKEHDLYARSYLCYGHNEARSRFLAHLVQNATDTTGFSNPCLPVGVMMNYTHSQVYSLCVTSETAVEVFGFKIPPPSTLEGTDDDIFTFVGTGDVQLCNSTIQEVFNFDACNVSSTCINGTYIQPPVEGHFVGFSGFWYTASFFEMADKTMTGWGAYQRSVTTFCNLNKTEAERQHPGDHYLFRRCFDGLFILHLLEQGLGFTSNNSWSVTFKEKVHGISVGWAMGYLLNQTSSISPTPYYTERPYSAVDLVVGMVILSILCVIFVVFFFLTFYACRKVIKTRSGYTDIA